MKNPPISQNRAHQAYLRGNYEEAITLQAATVNERVSKGESPVTERKLLGLYLYSAGQFGAAIEILKVVEPLAPRDTEIPENIGIMLRQSGNLKAAINYLLKAHEMSPEKPNICDGLAHCFGNMGDEMQCQHFGRLSLRLKDAEAAKRTQIWSIPNEAPPAFSFDDPAANVISFSLWGDNPRYTRGAIRNAQLAPDLYPGWTCRFYIDDSVAFSTVSALERLGAQIVRMPKPDPFYEGLLWRFRVIGDPTVKRYLVRDCDSVINVKERVAVEEWLAGDKWFHMMRDFISHTEMVLAGMFGGVNVEDGPFPPVAELREKFKTNTAPTRTYDQHFLRDMVWPTMRESVLIHDSAYTGELGSVPFPKFGNLGPRRHVGQNEAAIADFADQAEKRTHKFSCRQPFFIFGLKNSGTGYLESLINAHPLAICQGEQQLATIRNGLSQQITDYRLIEKNTSFDVSQLHGMLYRTWVEELMNTGINANTSHVGIIDNELGEDLPRHLNLFPEAKFVFVVRDPRDVAAARSKDQSAPLDKLAPVVAEQWRFQLAEVSKVARSHPGQIEMIRIEDLNSEKVQKTSLRKVFEFLGLNSSPETVNAVFEKVAADSGKAVIRTWEDELAYNQVAMIEKPNSDLMKRLRYQPTAAISSPDNRNSPPVNRSRTTESEVALPA